ncbi:MAG TPA: hypothetical protein VEO74_05915 [Thermoanaerobaculia bacterium]|nr:hypothetical protein [Thermoanaerobaculia bacterium]
MITKSDLQAAVAALNDEERASFGELPSVDELLAYRRGELSGEREARVREALLCYPELSRALFTPYQEDDGALSAEEIDARWTELQTRLHRGRVIRFPQKWTALAAAIAIVFAALFWRAESTAHRLARELGEPRATAGQLLLPDGQRGGDSTAATLAVAGDSYSLLVPLLNQQPFDSYRLEIANASHTLWRSPALHANADDTFSLLVPRSFLPPGQVQIVLYGVNGAREQQLARYSLRVH